MGALGEQSPGATRPGTRGHFQPFASLKHERGALLSRSIRDEKKGGREMAEMKKVAGTEERLFCINVPDIGS